MEKLPRERLIEEGASALRDDELLAIMLGTGTANESVFDFSKRICQEYGFERLYSMDYSELTHIFGIGAAKATKLLAVFEITKRVMKKRAERPAITTSKELFEYVYPSYMGLSKEQMMVIYTDSALKILRTKEYPSTDYTRITTPVKEIVRGALEADAYGVFLVHNHPSGNPKPSQSDYDYTYTLEYALKACDILLLDHIILGGDTYYSIGDKKSP